MEPLKKKKVCYWLEGEVKSLVGLVFFVSMWWCCSIFCCALCVCGRGYSLGDECKCFGFDCGNYRV